MAHRRAAETARQQCRRYTFLAENLFVQRIRKKIATSLLSEQVLEARGQDRELFEILDGTQVPEDQRLEDSIQVEDETVEYVKILEQTVKRILQDDKIVDLEHLWMCYGEMARKSEVLGLHYLEEVFFRMSSTEHKANALHSLELFEAIPKERLTKKHHIHAAKAAIVANSTHTALAETKIILEFFPSSIATDAPWMFRLAVMQEEWPVAVEIWYKFWQSPRLYHTTSPELLGTLHDLAIADLAPLAASAVRFILSIHESLDSDLRRMTSELASRLAECVLHAKNIPMEPQIYNDLLGCLRQLLGSDAAKYFEDAFFRLQSIEDQSYDNAALSIWKDLREIPSYKPSVLILNIVLRMFLSTRNDAGAIMILEDFRRHGLKVTADHYVYLAEIFAHAGQKELLESLLQDYLREVEPTCRQKPLHMQKMFNYLLFVHVKRHEVGMILDRFEQLQTDYGFVPNRVSYNFVMMALSNARDDTKMQQWFQKMKDNSTTPDSVSYATMMDFYAAKGDFDGVEEWLEEFKATSMKIDTYIIRALVKASLKERKLDTAEEYVRQATRENPSSEVTRLWNTLLEFYASNKDHEKVFSLQRQMQEDGVPEDVDTYTNLIFALCQMNEPNLIYAFFRSSSYDQLGVPRTAAQYALIMSCFLRMHQPHRVKGLYMEMLNKQVVPDNTVFHVLLQAAIRQDKIDGTTGDPNHSSAQKVLELATKSMDAAKLASSTGFKPAPAVTRKDAFISLPFSSMIGVYGAAGAFEEVTDLFNEYQERASRLGLKESENTLPKDMLVALMVTHRQANDREQMDKCWDLALEQAEKHSSRPGADRAEAGWVLPARRWDMNQAFQPYMEHLAETGSIDDLIKVVDDLRRAGYELSNSRLNDYVSHLASSPKPSHQYLAFELTEKELLCSWRGWRALKYRDRSIKQQFWQLFRDGLHDPTFKHPKYTTLVKFGAVFMDARSGLHVPDGSVSRYRLIQVAPETVQVIQTMPKRDDQLQEPLRKS